MAINSKFLQSDGTQKSYMSARQEGTSLYFTGSGDNLTTQTRGDGTPFLLENISSLPSIVVDVGFIDDIFLHYLCRTKW